MKLRPAFIITTLGLLLSAANALASPGHKKDSIGQPGDGQAVDRTIEVRMGDIFFEPKAMEIKAGETVRFVLKMTVHCYTNSILAKRHPMPRTRKRWPRCFRTARCPLQVHMT